MNGPTESGDANQPPRNEQIPPDLYAARITGTPETFAKLLQAFELDVGCRPHPELNTDGTASLLVYATEERIRALQSAGYKVERGENVSAVGRERRAEIGEGDRFKGGQIPPRGFGGKGGSHHERESAS
jgi:hypothetical protein